MQHRNTIVVALLAMVAALIPTTVLAAGEEVFFSEIHYDNLGTDTGEAIEVTAPVGMDMTGWSIVLYNGANENPYNSTTLSGLVPADGAFTVNYPSNGIQNGSPDGLALVDPTNQVVEFLSYEGTFTAAGGPAAGLESTDIGVFEPSDTPIGHSLQKVGDIWVDPQPSNFAPGLEPLPPTTRLISEVQGPGASTPFNGQTVTIEGVVVSNFQDNEFGQQLGGFNVQEETADQDEDPNTSEGIFVFAPFDEVIVGDIVNVTGTATEFSGLTEITAVTEVEIVGHDESEVVATEVSLPVTATSDWEIYEGMLVTFPQTLFISEFFNFDRFGEIVLTTERQFQGTHAATPGAAANAVTAANNLARITLDDARTSQNPDPAIHPDGEVFTLDHTFRGGDTLTDVTGTIHWAFNLYRVMPVHLDNLGIDGPSVTYENANPRPTTPDQIDGDVRVASFNVLNFFTHLDPDPFGNGPFICGPEVDEPLVDENWQGCRGANTSEELQRQLDKLVAGILALDADIVGIQEIENDIQDNEPANPNRPHDPILTLIDALNTAEQSEVWAWVGEANHYNDYPVRNEIIYRIDAVEPVGDPVALADEAFDKKVPGRPDPVGRPPLAQTFRQTVTKGSSQPFTVVVNHFKSKGSGCDVFGDPDTGDGQANCNLTRVAQSEALLGFVDELSQDSSGVLVVGDLNSYAMEDPITTLEAAGLTDLVEEFVGPDAYSFVFDGQLGYLDTALATRSMLNRVTGTTVFHINADEPDILDYDTTFKQAAQDALYEALPYRVSDHDPVIVGLTFGGPKGR